MPPTTQELSRGLPVDLAKIGRSLKQLWEQEGEMLTKASLVNFAVYSEAPDALSSNSRLMAEVTRENACRVILLAVNPEASKHRVQAWISAHCHVGRAGSKQVCSEQIAFLIEGGDQETTQSLLFSNLDSDLPLYLWWQGQFPEDTDSQLWTWVDRLFFDSRGWREPAKQMKILRSSVQGERSRTVLCDLNWRRLIYLRLALAQSFDHPWAWEKLRDGKTVSITHDPEYWTTAVLLVAWLSRQLGWALREHGEDRYVFTTGAEGREVVVELAAVPGPWVSRVQVEAADGHFRLDWNSDFLVSTLSDHPEMKRLSPAGGTSLESLVRDELGRAGEHRTYLAALATAERLWAA